MEWLDTYRLELTLGIGLVASTALGFVAWSLRDKNKPKKSSHGKAGGKQTSTDGKRKTLDDEDDEFKDANLYGDDEDGPNVYKDWN